MMRRVLLAVAIAAASTLPARAADTVVHLTLDNRPVDRAGGVAVMRDGVTFGDAVDLAKSFDGAITYRGTDNRTAEITIGNNTATFAAGSPAALLNAKRVALGATPFMRNGDLYIPLGFFVSHVASARLRVDNVTHHANIYVNANPLP